MPQNDKNSPATYTAIAKYIHWITALLIITNISWGLRMEHFPGYKHGQPEWNELLFYHASLGALIFWITAVRIVWRAKHQPPQVPVSLPAWQKVASKLVHGTLYLVMLALPLSGYIHRLAGNHPVSFWSAFDWPVLINPNEPLRLLTDKIHIALALFLIALILLHLGAVVKHVFIDRDGILKRML
jgi:cytochrome b561